MIRALFAPQTPAEELRAEQARVAAKKPHLAFSRREEDPRPDPDMWAWHDVAALIPVKLERGQ